MRDTITLPGFVHLPPRERLVRHALNKIRDRLRPEVTRREFESLCRRFVAEEFEADLREDGLDGRKVYHTRLWGERVRVIFDPKYESIVTVIRGWVAPALFRGRT